MAFGVTLDAVRVLRAARLHVALLGNYENNLEQILNARGLQLLRMMIDLFKLYDKIMLYNADCLDEQTR